MAVTLVDPSSFHFPRLKEHVPAGVVDPDLEKLARYRRSVSGRKGNNASRDFHRYIHRDQKVFGVRISQTRLKVRTKKPNKSGRRIKKEEEVDYPIITLSSWMKSILPYCPQFFLGGHTLDGSYENMLENFWKKFGSENPGHPINSQPMAVKRSTVPILIHGDEGRGLAKVPLLVISYQVLIPHNGPNELNMKKHFGYISGRVFVIFLGWINFKLYINLVFQNMYAYVYKVYECIQRLEA